MSAPGDPGNPAAYVRFAPICDRVASRQSAPSCHERLWAIAVIFRPYSIISSTRRSKHIARRTADAHRRRRSARTPNA